MEKEAMDIEEKCSRAADAVEQIEKLNRMIDMHINETQDTLMIGQYSFLRFRMIEKLKTVLESLHLKVEDTAHYVDRFQAEQKATENGGVQAFALAEAA
jgi:hypothetical protein